MSTTVPRQFVPSGSGNKTSSSLKRLMSLSTKEQQAMAIGRLLALYFVLIQEKPLTSSLRFNTAGIGLISL